MPTLTELKNGENPEYLEKLNKRVWCLLANLVAEQEGIQIKFHIGDEYFDTADPKNNGLWDMKSIDNKKNKDNL